MAHYVHCYARALQLAIQGSVKESDLLADTFWFMLWSLQAYQVLSKVNPYSEPAEWGDSRAKNWYMDTLLYKVRSTIIWINMLRKEAGCQWIKMMASYRSMTNYILLISMNFRWTVRADAVNGIITNYRHLLDFQKKLAWSLLVKGWILSAKFILGDASIFYGKWLI